MSLFAKLWSGKKNTERKDAISAEPDCPVPFGHRTVWMAARCADPERVIAALEPFSRRPANWGSGLEQAVRAGNAVFVSPCLDGWVLAVGEAVTHRDADGMAVNFPEMQMYACGAGDGRIGWKCYRDGVCCREYAVVNGVKLFDAGEPTPAEQTENMKDIRTGRRLPVEEDVLNIAAAWGLDPRFAETPFPLSAGWLCVME